MQTRGQPSGATCHGLDDRLQPDLRLVPGLRPGWEISLGHRLGSGSNGVEPSGRNGQQRKALYRQLADPVMLNQTS